MSHRNKIFNNRSKNPWYFGNCPNCHQDAFFDVICLNRTKTIDIADEKVYALKEKKKQKEMFGGVK
jgi:hypothetical protein